MGIVEKVMHRLDEELRAAKVYIYISIENQWCKQILYHRLYIIDIINLNLLQILIAKGFWHNQRGVQRSMLEKMGKSFVLALQSKLEEDDR